MTVRPDRIAADLRELAGLWLDLHVARLPSPRRVHAQQQPDAERSEQDRATALAERAERGSRLVGNTVVESSGPIRAPGNPLAAAAILDILGAALELEDVVREKLGDGPANRHPSPPLPVYGPWQQVSFGGRELDALVLVYNGADADPTVPAALRYLSSAVWRVTDRDAGRIGGAASQMLRAARSAVGDPPLRRWMPDARCPWCGLLSLFVADPQDADPQSQAEPEIRCMANRPDAEPVCVCPAGHLQECRQKCDLGGQHRWPESGWDRLAHVIYG